MNLLPTSIRAKLTLTAVAVIGVLFMALGGVIQVVGRERIMSNVDADLGKRADDAIQAQKRAERYMRPPPPNGQPDFGGQGGSGGPDGFAGPPPDPGSDGVPPPQDGGPRQPSQSQPPGGPPPDGQNPELMQGGAPPEGRLNGRDRGPRPGPRINAFRQALREVGNHLLAIGPRFIPVDPGPPIAPPDMMEPYDRVAIAAARIRGVVYSDVTIDGEKVRIITKMAADKDGRRWLAQVPYPLGDIDRAITTLNQTLLLLLPVGLLLTAAASLFLIQRVIRPIREMAITADSIGAEDLSGRLRIAGSDEFARLGGTINGMLGRLENAFAIQRKTLERLERVLKQQRRFTADASHELKTPLAVIKANTGLMLQDKKLPESVQSSVEAVDSAATRMNRLVQGLIVLARTDSGEERQKLVPFDLRITVQNAIDQVHRSGSKVVSYSDDGEELRVKGIESDAERVFVNLVDNACRHTKADGHVSVSVARSGTEAVATVTDDGDGIPAEHLPHIFERFYRVDSARSSETGGTGLGLAICKGIVESIGGQISIESEVGHGTTVSVRFPASA